MKELGIYLHIPFCKQKCYYCDFVSFTGKEQKQKEYVKCLVKEIQEKKSKINKDDYISTIYIGGGTPSYLDSQDITEILKVVKESYPIQEQAEITIEVNPGTVTRKKLQQYQETGINRLSIGLQSCDNGLLKEIGRIHTYEEFLDTYQLARKVGFHNINVDLMLALPGQTILNLKDSLEKIMKLDPEHISVYSLILEEGTKLERKIQNNELTLPDEETERQMYWYVKNTLELNGYIHYEISNFAKPGYESKHNLNCWKQKEYLGLGLAAHSYLNQERFHNIENLEQYISNIKDKKSKENIILDEKQDVESQMKEYMLLSLRTIQGVNIANFKQKFIQNPIYLYHKELDYLVKKKLIEIESNQIQLTAKGLDLANLVWEEFI